MKTPLVLLVLASLLASCAADDGVRSLVGPGPIGGAAAPASTGGAGGQGGTAAPVSTGGAAAPASTGGAAAPVSTGGAGGAGGEPAPQCPVFAPAYAGGENTVTPGVRCPTTATARYENCYTGCKSKLTYKPISCVQFMGGAVCVDSCDGC